MLATRYDDIGRGYASRRRPDPDLVRRIGEALAGCQTVVNVGAGAGSYEPDFAQVIAIEPSEVMAAQRPPSRPAIRATADALPLHDRSVDAAMTVLSLHHWHPNQRAGVRHMCRVAKERIVIVTIDAAVSGEMWLMKDYLTEVRDLDLVIFPRIDTILGWLDRPAEVDVVPVHRATPDWSLVSYWAHPERVLDPAARGATSGFARQSPTVVERVATAVRRDLDSGRWDERYGALRNLETFDAGLRLIRTL